MASVTTDRRRGINASAAIKVPCVCASTGNLTLSAEQTVDGITTSETRVFVKDQTDTTENGIYRTGTGAWVREPDFDGEFDTAEGTLIPVSRGAANADTYWRITNTGTVTIGTPLLTFSVTTVLSSAILQDGSVMMIANFNPNVSATYSVGVSTATWTSIHLSSAVNANSGAFSSNAVVSGAFTGSGTVAASSNATVAGTLAVSGASSLSSDVAIGKSVTVSSAIIGSVLTTALSGTDPGVEGQLWVSTSTGLSGSGRPVMVSTG